MLLGTKLDSLSWLPYDASLGARLLHGLAGGLFLAFGLTLLMALLLPLELLRTGGELGISIPGLVTMYFQGGVIGGGVFYALRPLHRTLPGVMLAGYLAAVAVLFTLTFSVFEDGGSSLSERLFLSTVVPLAGGPLIGLFQWWHDVQHHKQSAA